MPCPGPCPVFVSLSWTSSSGTRAWWQLRIGLVRPCRGCPWSRTSWEHPSVSHGMQASFSWCGAVSWWNFRKKTFGRTSGSTWRSFADSVVSFQFVFQNFTRFIQNFMKAVRNTGAKPWLPEQMAWHEDWPVPEVCMFTKVRGRKDLKMIHVPIISPLLCDKIMPNLCATGSPRPVDHAKTGVATRWRVGKPTYGWEELTTWCLLIGLGGRSFADSSSCWSLLMTCVNHNLQPVNFSRRSVRPKADSLVRHTQAPRAWMLRDCEALIRV